MNVGLVTDFYYPWIGGPATLIRSLGLGLAARGHNVSLLAPSTTGPPDRERDGPMAITRARTVPAPFGYNLRMHLPLDRAVDSWLDEAKPDVVHVHHPFPLSARAVFAARRRGIPAVATNHTIPECSLWGIRGFPPIYATANIAFSRWLVYLLGRCSSVATPTNTAARALRDLGFKRPITVISNGIDTDRFRPDAPDPDLRGRLGLDSRPVVLYTGRLDAEKQLDVWLNAAASLRKSVDVQFVIGGRGADGARLQSLAHELGIAGDVHFIGYLADEEYPQVYHLAQIYFITSPVELQSITTLEAAASGLPVVAVHAQALPELVGDGLNGFCVPPGDSAEASRALRKLVQDPDLARTMGHASREVALSHDLGQSIGAYERFLSEAVVANAEGMTGERAIALGG